jgi:hypothetical protein
LTWAVTAAASCREPTAQLVQTAADEDGDAQQIALQPTEEKRDSPLALL